MWFGVILFLAPLVLSLPQSSRTDPSPRGTTVTNDPSIFTLDPDFLITEIPQIREWFWTIEAATGAPDGYQRQMFTVNKMFPGPLIEANEGDTIWVHVTNKLDIGQTIHWHGMLQNGTQYNDGVPGFSQCPIPPGQTYTYQFTINNQYGTYWWHSHYANTLADGIVGGLIVHSVHDPLKLGQDFDEERIIYLSDWVHEQSQVIVADLLSGGYKGSVAPPPVDSVLINGQGRFNCSTVTDGTPCSDLPYPEIHVPSNKRIRFRIIHTGAHESFRLSIDNHQLLVVEADDCPVYGPTVNEIIIHPAQRYSFIVNTTSGSNGDAFWLRSNVALSCLGSTQPQAGLAVFRYVDDVSSATTSEPTTEPWDDLANATAPCVDMDQLYSLTPRVAEDAPTSVSQTNVLSSVFGTFSDVNGHAFSGFAMNGITYQNQINYPLLQQVEEDVPINSSLVANVAFDGIGGGDLIINNLDGFISHPYHLHGRPFFLVARGSGTMDAEGLSNVQVNTNNPLRRDTLLIPGGDWAVLRLLMDDPGVWPLHCHIGWHMSQGKLAAVVIRPDVIKEIDRPSAWLDLCKGTDRNAIGPA
ncbi:multi-copper oxidase laccase-like protein [Tremella mesenterica DSM 1558]|uniref:multi-copper oxidase laccase-like protein n=1 Tax=Tremella mesenterica (strain ATCC 24925 / CBS 8224 / DSM 1558 / NBRC 9311 / NRRL Y-6157 / RJB 2259-6 / UBC 559-6) TaxID=578456 RepID=UPI0003F4A4EC|nr:multi-copper oxidase laccase-like protein [Tremella mesenterica DSM 1558]EIW68417.1 multi-copper oxidase laccase-like protein [Tremella mesenterica DSM 1558]